MDPETLLLAQQGAAGAQVPGGPAVATSADGSQGVLPYTSATVKDPSVNKTSQSTQAQKTPEIRGAEGAVDEAANKARAAVEAQTGANVAKEAITAEGMQGEADIRGEHERLREELRKQNNALISKALAAQEKAREELRTHKATTYEEDQGPLRRFVEAIGLGLGAYGAARSGGPNTVFQIYQSNVEQHRKKQEGLLAAKVRKVEDSTGDIGLARQLLVDGMAQIQNREIVSLERAKSLVAAKVARVPQAANAGMAATAEIEQKQAEKKLEQANMFAKHITSGQQTQGAERSVTSVEGVKPGTASDKPTQFQQQMAMYGDTMQASIDQMRGMQPPNNAALAKAQDNEAALEAAAESNKSLGGAAKVWVGRKLGAIPRNRGEGISEDDQLYLNAMDRANEGFQRVLSGANIQEKERVHLLNQLQLQPNDPPKVVKWKLEGMEREKNNFMTLAGRAGEQVSKSAGATDRSTSVATRAATPAARPQMSPEMRADFEAAKSALEKDPKDARALRLMRAIRQRLGGQ